MELSQFEKEKHSYGRVKAKLALEESYVHPSPFLNAKSISERASLKATEELDRCCNQFRQGLEIIKGKGFDVEGDSIPISDQQLSQLLEIPTQLLEDGQTEQASSVLLVLTILAPLNSNLWLELGAIEQKKRNFDAALAMFMQAGYLNPAHPAPALYSSECCVLKGDLPEARIHLDHAISLIDGDERFQHFKSPALAIDGKLASAMQQQVFHGGEK